MAEQAHFAKYKISLKNNNKESQQVNEPTSQREIESTSRRVNRSTSQQVNEPTGQRGHEGRAIQEFVEVDRQKKEEKSQKFLLPTVIQSLLFYSLVSFCTPSTQRLVLLPFFWFQSELPLTLPRPNPVSTHFLIYTS